jgi:hypothetical protein
MCHEDTVSLLARYVCESGLHVSRPCSPWKLARLMRLLWTYLQYRIRSIVTWSLLESQFEAIRVNSLAPWLHNCGCHASQLPDADACWAPK